MEYKYYKPAWRSYCGSFMLMLCLIVLGCAVNYMKAGALWLKWMWIGIAVIDVLIFLYIAVKRATMSLILRDNPAKPEDQEVAFIVSNPLKPFSGEFRKSIEIGLSNIEHIEITQNLLQSMLNTGDIVITSSGTGEKEIRAKSIPNPQAVCDEIQTHARKYRA
ncbi:MAG: PH domain-containing protein [Synergistaceae bacterium]|nr:PH domain-containing protein [Synergistaceae bacterium]